MSEPAFELLENRQGECNSRTPMNASSDETETSNERLKLFAKGLHQVSRGGYFNLSSEDEALEHLLVELVPEYIDSVQNVLEFDAIRLTNCFSAQELSTLGYCHKESIADRLAITPIQQEKTTYNPFCVQSEVKIDDPSNATNDLPDIYEDYLLDAEIEECISDINSVSCKGNSMGYMNLDDQCADSGLNQCSSKIKELSPSSSLVSEAKLDRNSFVLDKMTVDELLAAFSSIYCHETTVTDEQWLKNQILIGLQNLDASRKCFSFLKGHLTSNNNEGVIVMPKEDELSQSTSSPLTGVFNFKTKPRGRHMRRYRHTNCDYLKTFSVEDRDAVSRIREPNVKESVTVGKGCRMPAPTCTDQSVVNSFNSPLRKFEESAAFSKGATLPIVYQRQCLREGLRPRVSIQGSGNNTSEVASSEVPFGLPFNEQSLKDKGQDYEACADSLSLSSDVETELYSVDSQDFSSEDSCISRAKTDKSGGRRKHHIAWSLDEVLQLVDGVSEYGVGNWTCIKRVLFPLSPHRSSVDLKDKWRNLLRASCRYSQSKNKGGKRQKNAPQYLPCKILDRVTELSLIYPYPRERKT